MLVVEVPPVYSFRAMNQPLLIKYLAVDTLFGIPCFGRIDIASPVAHIALIVYTP